MVHCLFQWVLHVSLTPLPFLSHSILHTCRQQLGAEYKKQVQGVLSQWEMDVEKSKELEEKLHKMLKEQQKLFQQQRIVQSQRLKTIKQLHEQYMKVRATWLPEIHICIHTHAHTRTHTHAGYGWTRQVPPGAAVQYAGRTQERDGSASEKDSDGNSELTSTTLDQQTISYCAYFSHSLNLRVRCSGKLALVDYTT